MSDRPVRGRWRPGAAVQAYLTAGERGSYPLGSVDWTRQPPLVKRYPPGGMLRLPARLAPFLRRTYGLTRYQWDDWDIYLGVPGLESIATGRPLRPVPCGGGLSSAELYLVGEVPGLPAGAYHYDTAADRLSPVRPGARPADAGVPGASTCLLIGSVFSRLVFKYQEFSYRLQCLDAGVIAGQALSIAASEGLTAEVRAAFDDTTAGRLLGLDPDAEVPLAAVTLKIPPDTPAADRAAGNGGGTAGTAAGATPNVHPPALPTPATRPAPTLHALPRTRALRAASSVPHGAGQQPPGPLPAVAGPREATIDLPAVSADIAGGWAARRNLDGRFGHRPLTLEQLATLAAAAGGGWSGDVLPWHLHAYLLVHNVAGLERGVYAYDPDAHQLHRMRAADLRERAWPPVPSRWMTGDHRAAVAVFPVGDYAHGIHAVGDRWLAMQTVAAGIATQRAALAAAWLGLGSRVTCSYDPDEVAGLLGLPGTLRPLCQVMVGPAGAAVAYTQPLPTPDGAPTDHPTGHPTDDPTNDPTVHPTVIPTSSRSTTNRALRR